MVLPYRPPRTENQELVQGRSRASACTRTRKSCRLCRPVPGDRGAGSRPAYLLHGRTARGGARCAVDRLRPGPCLWTIPAAATKGGDPHPGPLSSGATGVGARTREASGRTQFLSPAPTAAYRACGRAGHMGVPNTRSVNCGRPTAFRATSVCTTSGGPLRPGSPRWARTSRSSRPSSDTAPRSSCVLTKLMHPSARCPRRSSAGAPSRTAS